MALLKVCSGQGVQALCPGVGAMLPTGHGRQDATEFATDDAEYVPTSQGTQKSAPGSAHDPSGQHTVAARALRRGALPLPPPLAQAAQPLALKAGLMVSAPQGTQAMAPVTPSTVHAVPRGQGKQPGAAPLTKPALQQVAHPGAEKSPPPQGVQAVGYAAPTRGCAVFAGHGEQSGSPEPEEKVPAGQASHAVAPAARATEPAGHGRHDDCPNAAAYVPTPQGRHMLGAAVKVPNGHWLPSTQLMKPLAAVALKYPAAQPEQEGDPADAHCPAAQGVHTVAPAALTKPGGHCAQESAPSAGCAEPAAQGLHAPAAQNVPAGHSAHDAAASAYAPAGQLALAGRQEAPSSALSRAAAQGRHKLASVAPTATLYVPAAHREHSERDVAPAVELKRPAGHAVHDVLPGAAKLPRGQHTAAPALENVPGGHTPHWAEEDRASAALLRPGAQSRHAERSELRGAGLYVPMGQAVIAGAPRGQKKPGAQGEHNVAFEAAKKPGAQHWLAPAPLKVPALQGVQKNEFAAPGPAELNVFSGQSAQAP